VKSRLGIYYVGVEVEFISGRMMELDLLLCVQSIPEKCF
jgi:hypothetical protein